MTPAPPRELLVRFHRAMLAMSADALADLHASDATYEFVLLTPGRPERYHGREEIRAGFGAAWAGAGVRVDEIRNVVVHETTDPEVIVAEQEAAATVIATGRAFTLPFLLVLRARDGELVHVRDYADALRGALALDRLPALVERLADPSGSASAVSPPPAPGARSTRQTDR
jgi:ketosteroid isomerase-like protein